MIKSIDLTKNKSPDIAQIITTTTRDTTSHSSTSKYQFANSFLSIYQVKTKTKQIFRYL
jgi:hypothetical protein